MSRVSSGTIWYNLSKGVSRFCPNKIWKINTNIIIFGSCLHVVPSPSLTRAAVDFDLVTFDSSSESKALAVPSPSHILQRDQLWTVNTEYPRSFWSLEIWKINCTTHEDVNQVIVRNHPLIDCLSPAYVSVACILIPVDKRRKLKVERSDYAHSSKYVFATVVLILVFAQDPITCHRKSCWKSLSWKVIEKKWKIAFLTVTKQENGHGKS